MANLPFCCSHLNTDSIFPDNEDWSVWDSNDNPIDGNDTAQAILVDDQNRVEITVDFELADLGEQDANGVGGSPMTFKEANDAPHFVYSERYIVLQTYTIKNISASTIYGLEFYQMLHGHPADNYGTCYTSYTSTSKTDPLAEYEPYNSVHCAPDSNHAGNFRYDITQWNPGPWDGSEHVDWIGFSTTIEPDMVDCNLFEGHIHEPTTGTYVHIEERNLNGATYCEGQVAGAMQWNPGTLGPGDTNSITVAIMFGCPPVDSAAAAPVRFWKTDDVNGCVEPNDIINYEICYDANGFSDANVLIVDNLPVEVDFNSCTGGCDYDPCTHTATWSIPTMGPNAVNMEQTLILSTTSLRVMIPMTFIA